MTMCGLTNPRRTRTIRSEGVETTVTAPARGLTTTARLPPTTATFSGSVGIRRRFRTRPSGSEIASSAFCVSAVTSATGLPPPRAEPPPSAATTINRTPSLRSTEGIRALPAGRSSGMSRRPIYVEALIRAPLEEVWAKTQTPADHVRWDARFTSIEPLAGGRFRYATRIGFGLEIEGLGESAAERRTADGAATSALRFWSDDPRSLIRSGSGYWRYVPTGEGVRFLTGYDYETRWGAAGALVDRLLFRPLLGWA